MQVLLVVARASVRLLCVSIGEARKRLAGCRDGWTLPSVCIVCGSKTPSARLRKDCAVAVATRMTKQSNFQQMEMKLGACVVHFYIPATSLPISVLHRFCE